MKFAELLTLFGGLALFLYGMKMMSSGLEMAAGDKMQAILEKITSNRILGVLVGAGITAVIQSSSATTVMTVGFVNAGMLKLNQAVWIIMGANIGTTITGQMIATLDFGMVAPIFALVGVIMVTFMKNKRVNCTGEIIAGLGILFIGMNMMGDAMTPLKESEAFTNFIFTIENPLLAVLVGTGFTAVVQSSSASIGILQALAKSGLISLSGAAYILFGTNIGSCVTAALASLSGNRNAKRTTIVHLLFNFIGTAIFFVLCQITDIIPFVESWTPDSPMAQIANLHTLFNVVTTLMLLPFGNKLAELTTKILPIQDDERDDELNALYINPQTVGSTALALGQLRKEIVRMCNIARWNVEHLLKYFVNEEKLNVEKVRKNEDKLNYLTNEITSYLAQVHVGEVQSAEAMKFNSMFKISTDIERIGDHAMNLAEYAEAVKNRDIKFDQQVVEELDMLRKIIKECFSKILEESLFDYEDRFEFVQSDEQKVDDLTFYFRQEQITRLKEKKCDARSAVTYSEMLTDIERISDHIMNIAQECYGSKISLKVDE